MDKRSENNWTGYAGFIREVLFTKCLQYHPAPEDCEYYLGRP